MVELLRKRLAGLALLTVLVAGLAMTGFAHRAPSEADAAMAAFVLAGGDADELCAAGDSGLAHGDCPACHIVATIVAPTAGQMLRDADLILVASVLAPRESRAVRVVRDPGRGLRGPPLA